MKKGELDFKITDKTFLVPVVLNQPGLHSFKVSVHGENAAQGPINRTDVVSVIVGPGKADAKQSSVSFVEVTLREKALARFQVTPKNAAGQWLGPGYSQEFQAMVGRQSGKVEVKDQLDGSYQVELVLPKKRPAPVTVLVRGEPLWKGNI